MSTNPLDALLLGNAAANRFPPNSRYHGSGALTITLPDGRTVAYLTRRFVPQPASLAQLYSVRVAEGDRLDNLTARHLEDPELFWRLCDANGALRPAELEVLDRTVRIAAAEGMNGGADG